MAPEYVLTGRASQETDVYSFGIVALEIACGRRPILHMANGDQINIVGWLWEFYARGKLMEAADLRLQGNFDEQEMERLMILGLCCTHLNSNSRPLMKQVISMLNFDVAPPHIPLEMHVLSYMSSFATVSTRKIWTRSKSSSDIQYPSAESSTHVASSSTSSLLSGSGTRL
ncbi:hypothetical protein DITRI_Ditri08aG0094100 [Diplodiscus trichospermus]